MVSLVSLQISSSSDEVIRVGLNSMTGVLQRQGKFGHRDTEGQCHVKTELEIGMIHVQTQEHQGLTANARS